MTLWNEIKKPQNKKLSLIEQKKEFLTTNKFLNIKTPCDGNCFFHSINLYFIIKQIYIFRFSKEDFALSFTKVPDDYDTYEYNSVLYSSKYRSEIIDFIKNNEDIQNHICLNGGYNNKTLLRELNELKEDTKYEVPLFDFFPIIIATLYKINIYVYPLDIKNEECNFRDCQIYRDINGKNNTDNLYLLYINSNHYELLYNKY
jgi:hypothetical protein